MLDPEIRARVEARATALKKLAGYHVATSDEHTAADITALLAALDEAEGALRPFAETGRVLREFAVIGGGGALDASQRDFIAAADVMDRASSLGGGK